VKKRRKLSEDPFVRACRTHGIPEVLRAMLYVVSWSWVHDELGRSPSVPEYQAYWDMSERVAYREAASFKAVTGLDDPSSIVDAARSAGVDLGTRDEARDRAVAVGVLPFMTWSA
jgi:hypothetical protein